MSPDELIDKMAVAAAGEFGKETVKQALGWLDLIVRPPANQLGGLLADQIMHFRLNTQYKILEKARLIHDKFNFGHQKIPTKLVANLLDFCSWEEDSWMQDKWANLLANASLKDEKHHHYYSLVEILRQLDSHQVICLDYLYSEKYHPAKRLSPRSLPSYHTILELVEALGSSQGELTLLFEGLQRNNLIRPRQVYREDRSLLEMSPDKTDVEIEIEQNFEEITLTNLGMNLVRRCRIPIQPIQIKQICSIYEPNIERIARASKPGYYDEITSRAQEIYEYIDRADIGDAVSYSLSPLYKNHLDSFKQRQYTGGPIDGERRREILRLFRTRLRNLHTW